MNRQGKIFIILLCAALSIAVCIERSWSKRKETDETTTIETTIEENMESESIVTPSTSSVEQPVMGSSQRFDLKNGDVLLEKKLPSGIYVNMLAEIQSEIGKQLMLDEEEIELEIIEDSISITDIQVSYDIFVQQQFVLSVVVNLETFEYQFGTIKGGD